MRRRTLLATATAGVLGAAGCGGDGDPSSAASADGDAADGAFPARVRHRYGTTTVPRAPERVVVVGLREQDPLLALGVVPVAVSKWLKRTINPWSEPALGGREAPAVLPSTDGIDVEEVAAQRPDLIVGVYSAMKEQEFKTLSKLAPTIAPPAGVPEFGTDFRTETTMVGQAVGKPAQARRLVADVNRRIAAAKADNPQFAGRSGSAATTYEGVYVFGATDARPTLLRALGFAIPAAINEVTGDQFGANLSQERLDLLDTDVLLWQIERGGEREVRTNPGLRGLDVVEQGRIVFSSPGDDDDALTFNTVLSLPAVLEAFVPRLRAALDGDPDTETT